MLISNLVMFNLSKQTRRLADFLKNVRSKTEYVYLPITDVIKMIKNFKTVILF